MGIATRNALWVINVASWMIATLSLLLWLDSLTIDFAGYSTGTWNKLAIAALAAGTAVLSWRMLVDASELKWGLLVAAAGVTFVVGATANVSYQSPGCRDVLSTYLSFISIGCYERTDLGTAAMWWVTVSASTVTLLALGLPIIELWDRMRFEEKG